MWIDVTTWLRLFQAERLKLGKSSIGLLALISPLLSVLIGLFISEQQPPEIQWLYLWSTMSTTHAILFLPLLAGVFSAFICRYEHAGGGWKQMLALPVSRSSLYLAKFAHVALLLGLTQVLFLLGAIAIGLLKGYAAPIPWTEFLRAFSNGWLATLPVAALQLFVSVSWSSFAAPLAINVMLTLPNVLIVNSEKYGPWYPWAQPVLAMNGVEKYGAFNVSVGTLLFVIVGGFLLFLISGLIYFNRKDM